MGERGEQVAVEVEGSHGDGGNKKRHTCKADIRRTRSRLIDPPEESCEVDDEDEDEDKVEDFDKETPRVVYKRMIQSAFTALQWASLASIVAALLCNLWVPHLRSLKLWDLALWEWEIMMLVFIFGRFLSAVAIKVIVFLVERKFIMWKRVLYFVYGLKNSVKNSMWLGLVLLVWHFILSNTAKNKVNNKTALSSVTKILVCLFVGTLIWLLKTIFVKAFALSFHEKTFFTRMQEALFNHFVIETLSGPPLLDLDREKDKGLCESMMSSFFNDKKKELVGEETPLDQLHKLKRRNVSPMTMRIMINTIMHGGFTNLDEKILSSDIEEDGSLLQIRSKCQARKASHKIFHNVAQPGSRYIYLKDLMNFMRKDEALRTMDRLREASSEQRISMSSLREWVENAFGERRKLAMSLKDTKTALDELHNILRIVTAIIIFVVWLVIIGTSIIHLAAIMSSQLLVAVFVFGNTCRATFEAMVFLFLMHPFDVGDRCEVDGVQMTVDEMNILTTVFLKCDNQKIIYPNSVLATKPISNYRRSPDMGETIDFCIHISTPLDKVATMKTRIIGYIERKKEHWHPEVVVTIREVEELNKLNMSLWVTHRMNYQEIKKRWIRRTQLIEEIIKVLRELNIQYRLLPLHLNLLNFLSSSPPSNS